MAEEKIRIIQDYEKLSQELQEQVKLVYPEGFSQHLIKFTNKNGDEVSALRFETFEKIYMIRMTRILARQLMDDDDDFDDDNNLKIAIKDLYEEKHSEVEYLTENDNYNDDDDDL